MDRPASSPVSAPFFWPWWVMLLLGLGVVALASLMFSVLEPDHQRVALPLILLAGVAVAFFYRQQTLRALDAQRRESQTTQERIEKARQVLDQQRQRMNAFFCAIPDLLWLKDPEGRYLSCNPAFARLYGRPESEILGRDDYEFVSRELADFFRNNDRMAAAAGKPLINEEWLTFASDGYRGLFQTIKTPVYDSQKRLIGVLGLARDITALRQAEESLLEAQRIARIGSWTLDHKSLQLTWSPSTYEIFHLDPGKVQPDYAMFLQAIHPEDRALVQQAYEDSVRDHQPYQVIHRVLLPEGGIRFMEERGTTEYGADGSPLRSIGTVQDITERQLAAEQARKLWMAIEQSPDSIVITDPAGRIEYVNPAFENITGYTRAEAIGGNPSLLKSGEHDADFYRLMWDTLRAGQIWSGRIVNKRRQGEHFVEEVRIAPVVDAAGHVINYVAIKRDITDQQRLEEQLSQAQRMESIGRLAGGVAHDFNNILQVILGFTELLQKRFKAGDDNWADLDEIVRAAQHASSLTGQLLAFSRRQMILPRAVDLNALVSDQQQILQRLLGEDIRIEFQPAPGSATVRADPAQLVQVLMNLGINARDAMPGGGLIRIAAAAVELTEEEAARETEARPGRFIRLSVTDTGEGMNPEQLTHLFEPFYTTKPQGKGTGLGLSVVYGVVRQNEGWIAVSSRPGQGTTFEIYLPAQDKDELQPPVSAPPPRPNVGQEGRVILVVEDEEAILRASRQTLDGQGYVIKSARTLAEAHAVFTECGSSVDLLLTDVVLPDGSGLDLAEDLQALKPDLRVIVSSGYADERARWEKIQQKQYPFLPKPHTAQELLDAVAATWTKPTATQ